MEAQTFPHLKIHSKTEKYDVFALRLLLAEIIEKRKTHKTDKKLLSQLRQTEDLLHHLKKNKIASCSIAQMNEMKNFCQKHDKTECGVVKKILGEKRVRGKLLYQVEWNTIGKEAKTWEPAKIMEQDVPKKVVGWKKRKAKEKAAKEEEKQARKKRREE
mmetsp:Transcript_5571/g.7796  ORF Transcript_5571/g.7796 Transcript_5571/m.7796 type:complete len:159 (-) Transcript_5571:4-480(-)